MVAPLSEERRLEQGYDGRVRKLGDHKGRPYSARYNNAPGLFLYLFAIASALM